MVDSDPLASAAQRRPETFAILDRRNEIRYTYATLDRLADRIASGLKRRDVGRGDRVVLLGEHGADTVAMIHGIWRAGASVVPIDPSLASDRRDARIARINPQLVATMQHSGETANYVAVDQLTADTPVSDRHQQHPAQETCIIFTSGTTGTARAVRLSVRNLQASAAASASRLGVEPTDRWFVPLAPYHMGGFAPIVRCALAGIGLVIAPFDHTTLSSLVRETAVSVASVVPTMVRRDIEATGALSDLRVVLVGGDRTPPALVTSALAADVPLYVSYGMTEAASQIATAPPTRLEADARTVGRPLRFTSISIDDDSTPDHDGEIIVTGPTISPGYHESEETDRFPGPNTLRTGDTGRVENGWVYVTGRIDDRIISGGVTVDPMRVADVIREQPGIQDAAVVGIPDPEWGQQVCALIEGCEMKTNALRTVLEDRLSAAERPRTIEWTDELPRTPSGTVNRKAVRARIKDQSD